MNLRKTVDEVDKKYHDRKVVLVDDNDNELGTGRLVEAHRGQGLKHRAFSLQLYRKIDGQVELLLQQRAEAKPAFPYFWANTCCYNMAPGESYLPRAVSRVSEEMGVIVDQSLLNIVYKFSYYAADVEGWCENELDTVIVGEWDGKVVINSEEAMDYKWIEWSELIKDIDQQGDIYSPWFKTMMDDVRFRSALE